MGIGRFPFTSFGHSPLTDFVFVVVLALYLVQVHLLKSVETVTEVKFKTSEFITQLFCCCLSTV